MEKFSVTIGTEPGATRNDPGKIRFNTNKNYSETAPLKVQWLLYQVVGSSASEVFRH